MLALILCKFETASLWNKISGPTNPMLEDVGGSDAL